MLSSTRVACVAWACAPRGLGVTALSLIRETAPDQRLRGLHHGVERATAAVSSTGLLSPNRAHPAPSSKSAIGSRSGLQQPRAFWSYSRRQLSPYWDASGG